MLLMLDNHDSFTYNLVAYFEKLGQRVVVLTHDAPLSDLKAVNPDYLVVSPGPHGPAQSGVSLEAIEYFHTRIPVLGVCLGHQCIGEVFGMTVISAPVVVHGKTSLIEHQRTSIFVDLPKPLEVTRYHSLMIEAGSIPASFEITARCSVEEHSVVMGIAHREYPLLGVQFHPESVMTQLGYQLLQNFLSLEA